MRNYQDIIGEANKSMVSMMSRISELEAEVTRLRQQRDAANAQLDYLIENAYLEEE